MVQIKQQRLSEYVLLNCFSQSNSLEYRIKAMNFDPMALEPRSWDIRMSNKKMLFFVAASKQIKYVAAM